MKYFTGDARCHSVSKLRIARSIIDVESPTAEEKWIAPHKIFDRRWGISLARMANACAKAETVILYGSPISEHLPQRSKLVISMATINTAVVSCVMRTARKLNTSAKPLQAMANGVAPSTA